MVRQKAFSQDAFIKRCLAYTFAMSFRHARCRFHVAGLSRTGNCGLRSGAGFSELKRRNSQHVVCPWLLPLPLK